MRAHSFAKAAMPALLVLASGHPAAADRHRGADTTIALPAVEVSALRDPVEKSYRRIVNGMDVFEQRRGLAPGASLRFKLLPRSRDARMTGIALSIVGEHVNIPVPVAADHTFALERIQRALDDDAVVVPNREAGSMTWRADIRTPGLPPNTRRLGDLRLECRVGVEAGLVSNARSALDEMLRRLTDHDYCDQRVPRYFFFADRPLWSVTLVHGSRKEVLPIDQMYAGISRRPMTASDLRYCDCEVLLDRAYFAPLGDPTWPDDTRVELEYMDDASSAAIGVAGCIAACATPSPTAPSAVVTSPRARAVAAERVTDAVAIGKSTKADVLAALGETLAIRFDSGFEVWVYRLANDASATRNTSSVAHQGSEQSSPDASAELVILFAPSGLVAKTRVRPPPPRHER